MRNFIQFIEHKDTNLYSDLLAEGRLRNAAALAASAIGGMFSPGDVSAQQPQMSPEGKVGMSSRMARGADVVSSLEEELKEVIRKRNMVEDNLNRYYDRHEALKFLQTKENKDYTSWHLFNYVYGDHYGTQGADYVGKVEGKAPRRIPEGFFEEPLMEKLMNEFLETVRGRKGQSDSDRKKDFIEAIKIIVKNGHVPRNYYLDVMQNLGESLQQWEAKKEKLQSQIKSMK